MVVILKSSKVMTTERCLVRALLMMFAICAVCSRVPERLGLNPFCMLCSMKLLAVRYRYIMHYEGMK